MLDHDGVAAAAENDGVYGNLAELNHGLYPKLTLLELMVDQLRHHDSRTQARFEALPRTEMETSELIKSLRRESRARF